MVALGSRADRGDLMPKFEIGDRVEVIYESGCTTYKTGWRGILTEVSNDLGYVQFDKGLNQYVHLDRLKKIGEPMPKYQEIKNRIENLKDGWNKEADDILQIIDKDKKYGLYISNDSDGIVAIKIRKQFDKRDFSMEFTYTTQCQKMASFKQALLWLLDHSDIKKDDKQEKIDKLTEQLEDIQKQIEDMKK